MVEGYTGGFNVGEIRKTEQSHSRPEMLSPLVVAIVRAKIEEIASRRATRDCVTEAMIEWDNALAPYDTLSSNPQAPGTQLIREGLNRKLTGQFGRRRTRASAPKDDVDVPTPQQPPINSAGRPEY